MAIYIKLPKAGSDEENLQSDGRVAGRYSESRQVKADEGETYAEVKEAVKTAFPYLSASPINPFLTLKSYRGTQIMSRDKWRTFEFDLEWNNEPFDEPEENPLARPFKWSSRGQGRSVAVDKDRHGDAILTSAKKQPTTLPEKEVYDGVLTGEGNVPTYSESVAALYRGKLNSVTFLGYPPRSVKCLNVSGEGPLVENEVTFYKLTVEVAHRPGPTGWDPERLDQDVYKLEAGKSVLIRDDNDEFLTAPVMLDGAGNVVPVEDLPDEAHYIKDEIEDEIDLTGLLT